jgi:hypothetical protein
MNLIASAACVKPKFQTEFGRRPPARSPMHNRRCGVPADREQPAATAQCPHGACTP